MRKLFFLTACAVVCTVLSAQTTDLLLEEDFEYEAPRVLISDPIDGSDNLDAVTGWSLGLPNEGINPVQTRKYV